MPYRAAATRTPKRWGGAGPDKPKGTAPEKSAHRGSCGAGYEHRARDAGWFRRTRGKYCLCASCNRTQGRGFDEPRHPARPRPFRAAPLRRRRARAANNRAGGALALGSRVVPAKESSIVVPAQAGTHIPETLDRPGVMDSRFRGNDKKKESVGAEKRMDRKYYRFGRARASRASSRQVRSCT